MRPELISHCSVSDRDLYFLSVSSPSLPPENISIPSPHYSVFIAVDATKLDRAIISSIARRLLRTGAAYFCCFGPDCERVHDIIDEELLESSLRNDDGSVIMTTWHDDETLLDALWFFVFNSWPDDKYFESCRAGIALSFGNPEWDAQIVAGLKDLTKIKAS